jgi:hypothetical protein
MAARLMVMKFKGINEKFCFSTGLAALKFASILTSSRIAHLGVKSNSFFVALPN